MAEIAPLYAQQIRLLSFGAQALLYKPTSRLLAFVGKFPALKKFTLYYSSADESAQLMGIQSHRLMLSEIVAMAFTVIEQKNIKWKRPDWEMEYIYVSSAAEQEKIKDKDKEPANADKAEQKPTIQPTNNQLALSPFLTTLTHFSSLPDAEKDHIINADYQTIMAEARPANPTTSPKEATPLHTSSGSRTSPKKSSKLNPNQTNAQNSPSVSPITDD
jgi:hypothetical protein